MKQTHYRIVAAIVGCIILLVIVMASQPPKIETQIVEIEKEKIVTVEKESAYKYNISSVEREMLARLVYLEANTESLECQSAIASVVMNRLESGDWGETLYDVVYAPYQFSPAEYISNTTPTEMNYKAVDYILKNGSTLPSEVQYFRTDYGFSKIWKGYSEYKQIDRTFFGFFEKDKRDTYEKE